MNLATLGIKVDLTDVKKTPPALDKITSSAKKTEQATKGLTDSQGRLVASSKRASAANDNLGKSSIVASKGMSILKLGVIAAITAITALAAGALRSFISATSEAQDRQAQLAATIASTSGAAGQSLSSLNAHAAALQKITRYGDEVTNSAQGILLSFTKIKGDTFPRATEAVLDVATALKTDLKSAAIQVGKALNDPVLGMTALSRSGITFSDSQKEAVKQMVKLNDIAGAQALILTELETQFGGSARAARDTLGGAIDAVKNSFGDLFELSGVGVAYLQSAFERLSRVFADPVFAGFVNLIGNVLFIAMGLIIDAVNLLVTGFNTLGHIIGAVFDKAKTAFMTAAEWAGVSAQDMADGWEIVKQSAADMYDFIVGGSVGTYRAILVIWDGFPAALGDIGYRAGVAFVNMLLEQVNNGIGLIQDVINSMNSSFGTSIGLPSTVKLFAGNDNPYKGAASQLGSDVKAAFNDGMNSVKDDGGLAGAIKAATTETDKLGGSAGKAKDAWKDLRKATSDYANDVKAAANDLAQSAGGIFKGLIDQTMTWKDAAMSALKSVLTYFNSMNKAGGGGGIFGGGIFQSLIGGFLGMSFDGGGHTGSGPRSGGMDGKGGFPAMLHPNETVIDHTKTQARYGNAQQAANQNIYSPSITIDARGADQAAVSRMEKNLKDQQRDQYAAFLSMKKRDNVRGVRA